LGSVKAANRHGEIGANPPGDRPCWVIRPRNSGESGWRYQNRHLTVLAPIARSASAQQSPMLEDARRRMEATRTRPRRRRAQDRAALYTAAAKGAYQGVKIERGVRLCRADHAGAVRRGLEQRPLTSADICNDCCGPFARLFGISLCLNLITPAMPRPISNTATTRHNRSIIKDRKLNFVIWHPPALLDDSFYFPLLPARRFI